MQLALEEILHTLVAECYVRRNTIFVLFVVISLTLLIVGSVWPKRYTSFTIIHVDQTNILQPLMHGTAETTASVDHAGNAREIIYGDKIMDEILKEAGWLKTNPSEIEQEKIKEDLKTGISVVDVGNNLIKIEYRDTKPMRAYITARKLGDLFISEGERSKIEESQAAYAFIDNQVQEYLQKLTSVEDELRKFRSENPDVRPGQESELSSRIATLQSNIEQTRLLIRETTIKRDSIKEQLSGEAAITISQSKEGQYRAKISELQTQLETLRLDYNETYPDIVRLKHQIDDLKNSMISEIKMREQAQVNAKKTGSTYIDESILVNPLYQQLRSELSATETQLATLNARISETNKMIENEYSRARKIHGGEATLTKLTRDYQVNQDIYQDLLRRRENANVSRSLDRENQGLTFKIQEPAKVPLLPTGLRFIHFAAAGLLVGLLVPIGLVYLNLQLDPRIRFSRVISNETGIPVLAEVYHIRNTNEDMKEQSNIIILYIGTFLLLVIYGIFSWLKFMDYLQ